MNISRTPYQRIVRGVLWILIFVIISRLAGAGKEIAIAWRYGIGEIVDAYFFVFNLINFPIAVWYAALATVMLPLLAKIRTENPSAMRLFRGEFLALTLIIGATLGTLCFYGLPLLFEAGWSGLEKPALDQAVYMTTRLSLVLPVGFVTSALSVWIMAAGHRRNTLFESIPPLMVLLALVLPNGWVPEPLIWGTIAGVSLQMASLARPLYRWGELYRPLLGFKSPAWRGFWQSFGVVAIGQAIMGCAILIDQFFAAHLGTGTVSTLSYSSRVVGILTAIGAISISRSTLPIFAELASEGRLSRLRSLTLHFALLMFLLGLVAVVFIWLLADWIVAIIFQRGAFTLQDSIEVANIARHLILFVPSFFSGLVFISFLSAVKKFKLIGYIATFAICMKILILIFLFPHIGLLGIIYSNVIMHAVMLISTAFLYLRVSQQHVS